MNTTTTCTNFRGLIAAAIFSVAASSFTGICAADSSDARSTVVKYADLNIANPQDAATLYSRIRKAAEGVCWRSEGNAHMVYGETTICVHKAIADSVTAVNQPALSAVYNAKNRTPLPVILAADHTR
jgi:UrcA family protein